MIYLTRLIDPRKTVEIDGKMVNLKFIDRVGAEYEGKYQISHLRSIDHLGHFTTDGSVSGNMGRIDHDLEKEGEFISKAVQPTEILEFLEKCHPNHNGENRDSVNSHTGGHLHVSLLSHADYQTLMTKEFYQYFISKLVEFGHKNEIIQGSPFWDRIEGKSLLWANQDNIQQKQHKMRDHYDDDRYYHVNYCFNVEDRHTIEFRILPMFKKVSLQKKATLEILRIVQQYLEDHPIPKPITLRLKI